MTSTIGASPTQDGASSGSAIEHVKDAALEKTAVAREKLGTQLSQRVRDQADEQSTSVGKHVTSIASALHDTGSILRNSGDDVPAKALDAVTTQVEQVGSYLTQTDGTQLLHDIEGAARKRPWATAGLLFGIGFAASRVLGASSRERHVSGLGQTGVTTSLPGVTPMQGSPIAGTSTPRSYPPRFNGVVAGGDGNVDY